ncbi:hypothetical protein GCM10011349_07340 [Novosphingobium indicum]|uniref:Beta/gamma crystallin 'Greek key' domain-containing protein n=1 Tax=Novosphingobium indicum TaxID=462949 RepID=A0ABQ2JA17_9SPHN|nr:hypothetical protein [Novosphingobium indicum]GGN43351.1 hypothetical protein GCM10011349_07340 [Novosphingobium indicum]
MPHVALALPALFAASAAYAGPSPAEFANAVAEFTGKSVSVTDIRRLSCKGFDEEPTEAECKWQQRSEKKWKSFSTYVAVDRTGWHLIDAPSLNR